MKKTPICERLGIDLPVVLAPMAGGPSTPALCASVSEAGGLGSYGAAYLPLDRLRAEIRAIRAQTSRPFAVNLFADDGAAADAAALQAAQERLAAVRAELGLRAPAAAPAPQVTLVQAFPVLLEEKVPVFSFTFGIPPAEVLAECRRAGVVTMGTATSVAEARALEAAGVDTICAQGAEAGGHRGAFDRNADPPLVGTMALVPQVVDAVRAPVVAAGGIMDGRGIAAALALGAQAVSLGTAFLRCPEAGTSAPYRSALRNARDDATVITRAFSGRAARGLANRFTRQMAGAPLAPYPVQNSLTREIRAAAAKAGNAEFLSLWAGQAAAMGRELPARDLVLALVRETNEAISRLSG
ncbi:MAG TPA: nitronate monooxygenase [Myxococcales bacterium]|nr:nitronate monooxygenase [Myxococcales bacterium]